MTQRSRITAYIVASTAVSIVSSCGDYKNEERPAELAPAQPTPEDVEIVVPDRQAVAKDDAPAGLHERGYQSITIGSKVKDTSLSIQRSNHPGAGECAYARVNNDDGMLFMVVEDTVVRIDVLDGSHNLPNGLSIGSTGADIQAVYGDQVVIEPHKYDENSSYYALRLSNAIGLVFEVSGEHVARYRVGRFPEVEWVEGCL